MAGTDTSFLLEILQGHFGCVASSESDECDNVLAQEEKTSEVVVDISVKPTEAGNLITAELVFPFKSSPLVVAGIPEIYLPLCGPEILSHYHCQVPSCTLDFAQKAVACNHVCCDHLNIAFTCLYYSFKSNPKMQWYNASAWQHHSLKHLRDNLPIYPDDPTLLQQFMGVPSDGVVPSTSRQSLPHEVEVRKWAEAAKQYFEEEQDLSKQGPIKSSKELKFTSKDDDELVTQVTSIIHLEQPPTQEHSCTLRYYYANMMLIPVFMCKLLSQ